MPLHYLWANQVIKFSNWIVIDKRWWDAFHHVLTCRGFRVTATHGDSRTFLIGSDMNRMTDRSPGWGRGSLVHCSGADMLSALSCVCVSKWDAVGEVKWKAGIRSTQTRHVSLNVWFFSSFQTQNPLQCLQRRWLPIDSRSTSDRRKWITCRQMHSWDSRTNLISFISF